MGGWIAPDGSYYACRNWQHTSLAYELAERLYRSQRGELALEDRGWLRLDTCGTVKNLRGVTYTQAQLDTLFDLHRQAPDKSEARYWLGVTLEVAQGMVS